MGTRDSLIGHLSDRFATQPENLATEALVYVLTEHEAAGSSFAAHAQRWNSNLPLVHRFRSQGYGIADHAIPDLIGGTAAKGAGPLLVEVKFWAPLTRNQPLTYLDRLASDGTGLLLFLCPDQRVESLWDELLDRCVRAGRTVVTAANGVCAATVDAKALGVTSWRAVLDAIAVGLDGDAASDYRQLVGLVESQDRDTFLPLANEELSGNVAHRLRQYRTLLIPGVVDKLKQRKMVEIGGLKWANTCTYCGRYMSLKGWEVLLEVHLDHWAEVRDTPLWLELTDHEANTPSVHKALEPLAAQQPSKLLERNGRLVIPLTLSVGTPVDLLEHEIVEQILEVRRLLPRRRASPTAPAGPSA